jgi:hypothetical protein
MYRTLDFLGIVLIFTIGASLASLPFTLGAYYMTLFEARTTAQQEANEDGLPRFVVTYVSDGDEPDFDILFMYDGCDDDVIIWSEVNQQAEVFDKVFESLESLPGYEQP